MDEEAARAWLHSRLVPRETMDRLAYLVTLVREENGQQNLIAASTLGLMWSRHVVDSAQLLDLASEGEWADVGTGAGFPGLVIALLTKRQVTLIEPRARRADFLRRAVAALDVRDRVQVVAARAERLPPAAVRVLSARAVAALPDLLAAAGHLAAPDATWLLPKGRGAAEELAATRQTWQGRFELVPSITDPAAAIVVARNVRPRKRR